MGSARKPPHLGVREPSAARFRAMSRALRKWLLATALALATVAAYAPCFSAGFVDIDDPDYVTENEMVGKGLSVDGVRWAFHEAHAGNWFPLTWLSHMADVELFGVEPAAHHAIDVALHVANALLLFGMLASMTDAIAPSFAVAALFALHPANVESVAWVSQRKTTLSTLFGILSIWSYGTYARRGSRGAYAASLGTFALSLLSKQTLVTLPLALLLLDGWPLRRTALGLRRLLVEKIPYAVLAAAAGAATIAAQGEGIATGATFPLAVRLGNAVISYVRYLALFAWPADLAVFYPLYEDDVTVAKVVACAALLLAITGIALALARRLPYVLVGWLWFLGTLVPTIGLVQVGAQAMADRYAYIPFWGLSLALVWTGWETLGSQRAGEALRMTASVAFCLLCAALALLVHRQAEAWHDSVALFESAVAHTPRNYIAHRALAGQYFNRGDYGLALRHAEEGARYPRELGDALPTWGMALYQTGSRTEGIAKLEEATRVAPRSAIAFSDLGWVYLQEGQPERAREALSTAVALDPRSSRSLYQLGLSQLQLGRLEDAAASFEGVVRLDPRHFDAWIWRARTLARQGRFAESSAALQDALAAATRFGGERHDELVSTLHQYRGEILTAQGDVGGAIAEYEQAAASWAESYAADASLAVLLATTADPARRDPGRAVELAERACALSARRPDALAALSAAYRAAGRPAEAAEVAREARDRAREAGGPEALAALEARLRAYGEDAPATDPPRADR